MGVYEKKQKEFKRTVIWLGVIVLVLLIGIVYAVIVITDVKVNIDTANLFSEFQISQGQTILLNEKTISITLQQVLSDSRCPIDAFCIQAGSASIKLFVETQDEDQTITLDTTAQTSAKVGRYTIQLVQVTPHPGTTELDVPLNQKVAVLIVS